MNGKTTKRLRKALLARNKAINVEDTRRNWRRVKKLFNKIPRNERAFFLESLGA